MTVMTTHKIVSGEEPTVGLRVFTNDWTWGAIAELGRGDTYDPVTGWAPMDTVECGTYCKAWHRVALDNGTQRTYNCDRLTTRPPRGSDD